MTPVFQDKFGGVEGNCMAACVASILDLPLREVPNFVALGRQWFAGFYNFMQNHGFEVICYWMDGVDPETGVEFRRQLDWDNMPEYLKDLHPYHMTCGPAARGFSHATVGWRDQIVHDPHPSKAGLIKVDHYYFFKPVKR